MSFKLISKIAIVMSISLPTCAQNNFRKIGPVYSTLRNGVETIISVIETKESTEWNYQLQLTNCKTADILLAKSIKVMDKQITHEQIIGKLGNLFWILTDSLRGYDVNTLDVIATETQLEDNYPPLKSKFSRSATSYVLDEAAQVLYISSLDGVGHKLYPDLHITADKSNESAVADEFSYDYSASYVADGKYRIKYAVSCVDNLSNKLYIVGSEKETSQVLSSYGGSIYPERDEIRQVNIIPYSGDRNEADVSGNKPTSAVKQYFGAAMLLNKFCTTGWHGKNNEHLLLYRSGPGAKGTLCAAMINQVGGEKWTLNTGLAYLNFNDYLVTENSLVLWMDHSLNGQLFHKVIYINLADGKHIIR